jgi:amino acid transporter
LVPRWLAPPGAAGAGVRRALWLIAALACLAPWFGRPALVWLVNAGSLGVIVAYGLVALAFVRLRARAPELPRPYRVPGGTWCGWTAFALALLLALLYLPPSPSALAWPEEWLICGLWVAAGVLLYRRQART